MKPEAITIKGTKYTKMNGPIWFEIEDLPLIGAIRITDIGSENMYFTVTDDDGREHEGFVKIF